MPIFIMYPVASDKESMTYKYSFKDYDNAMEYDGDELILKLYESSGSHQYDKKVKEQDGEVTFNNLKNGKTYELEYRYGLIKNKGNVEEKLFKQLFKSLITDSDMEKITYELSFDNSQNPNNIIITLQNCTNVENIIGGKVTLEWVDDSNDKITETTELLGLNYDRNNDKYFIDVDVLSSLKNAPKIIGKEVSIAVKLYYDNNYIGFKNTEQDTYSALVNTSDKYQYIDNDGTLNDAINGARGNAYTIEFVDKDDEEYVYLNATNLNGNNKKIELKRTGKGLTYGGKDEVIVQKEIVGVDLMTNKTVEIENLIAGINIDQENIETTLQTAKIPAELINPDNKIGIDKIFIEISKKSTSDYTQIELTDENWKENVITLEGLEPTCSYVIKFKYKGIDGKDYNMYDKNSKEIGKYYYFDTMSTIGINNINVSYDAKTYREKYLNITYCIDSKRSNMYPKTKYEFFDGSNKKVTLDEYNIYENDDEAIYEIKDGALYVTNSKYNTKETFENVVEKIDINPSNNTFEFGKKYTLKITPIVNVGKKEEEIETESFEFKLEKLSEPKVGVRVIRQEDDKGKKIKATINISDVQCNVYGESNLGEYKIQVFKYIDIDNKEEIKQIIDVNNENVYGNTLNIRDNGSNYSIYINENVDYNYNYEIKLTMEVDMNNNETKEEKSYSKVLKAINNQENIEVGDNPQVVSVNDNSIELMFFDSYNLQKINNMTYTLYDALGMPIETQNKVIKSSDWIQISATENNPDYYKITLDGLKNEQGINILEVSLKYGDMEIKRFAINYEYKK